MRVDTRFWPCAYTGAEKHHYLLRIRMHAINRTALDRRSFASRPPAPRPLIWLLGLLIACSAGAAWSLPTALLSKPAKAPTAAVGDPSADRAARDQLTTDLRSVDGLQAVVPSVSNGT